MLISKNLHKKSSEVSIKTRSTLASLSFISQVTKHTTVKWTVLNLIFSCCMSYVFSFLFDCVCSTGGSDSSVSDGLPMHIIYAAEGLKLVC